MEQKNDETQESLIRMLRGDSVAERHRAREQLVALGQAAVPSLNEALKDENAELRWEVAMTLKRLPYADAAPALVGALEDENGDVRWVAAEALMVQPREGLRALLKALVKTPDSIWLREGAHLTLSNLADRSLREEMEPLTKALAEFTQTGQGEVLFQAEKALERVGG
jgi:HEAT repeat protein